MPEIKQNFIRGKMNKDLDERLIQKGEYREAQNVHIVESTDSDTGALENTRGNVKMNSTIAPNLNEPATPTLLNTGSVVIGYCKDVNKKRIIYFVTDIVSNVFADNIRANTYHDPTSSDPEEANQTRCAIILYDVEERNTSTLVVGSWLNFSKNHLITGAAIIDDLLFWTDDYNQPRKINIQTALDNYFDDSDQYYNYEEQISVAKYAPYKPIILHEDNGNSGLSLDTSIDSEYMKERFVRFSYRYRYDDGEYSLFAPFTQAVFEPLNAGKITNSADDNETNSTSGELEVLTGKKELYKSTTVPIMQNRLNKVVMRIPIPNQNEFQIAVGSYASSYSNPFNIKEIDIVLKESDGVSFKLVKTIQIDELDSDDIDFYTIQPASTGSTVYYRQVIKYEYTSGEPFKTLPEREVTRVSDQVPLKAKALDVVSNRVVFGNYVENYPFPIDASGKKGMNYKVGVSSVKGDVDQDGTNSGSAPYLTGIKQWMHNVYKYHTLKQRRTYQVGIVFSDIFGRQSPVILSSSNDINADTITTSAVANDYSANLNGSWSSSRNTYGQSLRIDFQEAVLTVDSKFKAVLDKSSSDYNPHGWYSYRIVVKQLEQDYYNIYCSHPFDGWDNINDEKNDSLTGGRSWLALHGDNINKVPRALNDQDINRDGVSGSNVRLYPKVVFLRDPHDDTSDGSTYKGESRLNSEYQALTEVISLGTALEQNLYLSGDDNTSGTGGFSIYNFVYGKDRNPIIAELVNMKKYYAEVSSDVFSNNFAEELFVTSDSTTPFNEVVLGTGVSDYDDQYNAYSINSTSVELKSDNKVLKIEDFDAGSNTATISSNQNFTAGDRVLVSNYLEGLSVFETEPFESKIDIYYETSTAGLVSDLMEEINVDTQFFPSDLLLKQDTLTSAPFTIPGGDQPPVGSGDADYGQKVFIYEDFDNGDVFGILSATQNTSPTGILSFALEKVVNVGTGQQRNEIFDVFNDSGTFKIRTTGSYYVAQLSNDSKFKVTISATDSNSGTSYHDFDVEVQNTKPNISAPATATLPRGGEGYTIAQGPVDNGSNVVSGTPNNQLGLTIGFSLLGSENYRKYFNARISNGNFFLTTTSEWTESNAATFFADNATNRTIILVLEDAFGSLSRDTANIVLNELFVVDGLLKSVKDSDRNSACDSSTSFITYYAIQHTGSSAPYVPTLTYPTSGYYGELDLRIYNGNKIFTDISLTKTAPAGFYLTRLARYTSGGVKQLFYYQHQLNSDGVVIDAYRDVFRDPC